MGMFSNIFESISNLPTGLGLCFKVRVRLCFMLTFICAIIFNLTNNAIVVCCCRGYYARHDYLNYYSLQHVLEMEIHVYLLKVFTKQKLQITMSHFWNR